MLVEAAAAAGNNTAISAADRWGGTPLSDATNNGFGEIVQVLTDAGATSGTQVCTHCATSDDAANIVISDKAPEVLFAAAEGDLDEMIKLRAKGVDITICDYDRRSALHLAASNGHANVVQYILAQAGDAKDDIKATTDRWGNTPGQDAIRGEHADCQTLLA